MKTIAPISFMIALAMFFFTACNSSDTENAIEEETVDVVEEEDDLLDELLEEIASDDLGTTDLETGITTYDLGKFAVAFPGQSEYDMEVIPTEIGDVELHTYIYEESIAKAYMVSFTDYPAEIIELSDPKDLLTGGMDGAMGSLGIEEPTSVEDIEQQGYPGLAFEGDDGTDFFVRYELFLKDNRLYQVAVLQEGDYPRSASDMKFFDSFSFTE